MATNTSSTTAFTTDLLPEIWEIVAEFLPRAALYRLSLVSRQHNAIAKPKLYRNVVLDECEPSLTLYLLSQDERLAGQVQTLVLRRWMNWNFRIKYSTPVPTWYLPAIQNMRSLKRLALYGSIFNNASDQDAFVSGVAEGNPPLEELHYAHVGARPLPSDNFRIPNLSTILWNSAFECMYICFSLNRLTMQ